jgi:hypothetical protein
MLGIILVMFLVAMVAVVRACGACFRDVRVHQRATGTEEPSINARPRSTASAETLPAYPPPAYSLK